MVGKRPCLLLLKRRLWQLRQLGRLSNELFRGLLKVVGEVESADQRGSLLC